MTTTENRTYLRALPSPTWLRFYDPLSRLLGTHELHWQLVAQAGIEPGATVLEIGCGTAALLLLAKHAVPDISAIGLDPDADALALARRKATRDQLTVRLDRGYADRLPYADGSVDRVLSSFMLHHLPGPEQVTALREVRRVLAPGGRLHVLDLNGDPRDGLVGRLLSLGRRRGGEGHGHGHGHGQPASIPALLTEAGLVDVTETGRGTTPLGSHTFYRASR
ncbi:class I SAM-dependent methyltransferase [Pseudonocardia sp. GCM10023141]|uniref:class I SAM-dependent methyltransferase n=1 Tax=Pseudonocardia sp. GCM10023141 TaxID=3252653 RepID=UPI00361D0BE7